MFICMYENLFFPLLECDLTYPVVSIEEHLQSGFGAEVRRAAGKRNSLGSLPDPQASLNKTAPTYVVVVRISELGI